MDDSCRRSHGSSKLHCPAGKNRLRRLPRNSQTPARFSILVGVAHYAIAREGALKLKESAYLNAEGYPSGELKHGPNALVSKEAPLIMIATADVNDPDSLLRYSKVLQLMKDMREQGARIIALATEGDREVPDYSDSCLFIPASNDLLSTILEVVPLQLLAYTLAISRGIDVDRPRNLVKAVVEE